MVVPTTLCTTRPTVVLFTADWCGHCIKAKTQFTILQEDTSVHVVHYESGNNDNPQYVAKAKEFQIVGYPSIFIYTNNIWYKYNKQNMADTIQQYAMNPDTDIWYIISTHVTCLDIQKRTSMKVILLPMLRLTKIKPTQSTLISCECTQCMNAAM